MEPPKKSHSRRHKSKPKNAWKIINEVETTTTTDQDSDGTTGSIGRTRDSSSAYSSNICEDEKTIEPATTSSKTTKKKRNKKNQVEKVNSLINAVLVAALLVVSGLASGHFIASHTSHVVSPAILNRYINRTIETYQNLLEENAQLRSKINRLEYKMPSVSANDHELLHNFVNFFEKEVANMLRVIQESDQIEKIEEVPEVVQEPAAEVVQVEVCPISESPIDSGKAIPSSTDVQEFQTILADLKRKRPKKNRKTATQLEESVPVTPIPDFVMESVDTGTQIASYETVPVNVTPIPDFVIESLDTGTQIASYDSAHTGYVQHIKKLFEPTETEMCPKEEGDIVMGPQLEEFQEQSFEEEYNLNYPSSRRSESRDGKNRKMKDRSNEGNSRVKRKMKHDRD